MATLASMLGSDGHTTLYLGIWLLARDENFFHGNNLIPQFGLMAALLMTGLGLLLTWDNEKEIDYGEKDGEKEKGKDGYLGRERG